MAGTTGRPRVDGRQGGTRGCDAAAGRRARQSQNLVSQAAMRHALDHGYLAELATWSGRYGAAAGVPARSTPESDPTAAIPARAFAGAVLAQTPDVDPAEDNAVVIALGTAADDDVSRLRAGEATSLVLLTATALGLASCPITEPLEIPETRAAVRADVFGADEYPQMLLRLGWAPVNADPLSSTPRRPWPKWLRGWTVHRSLVEAPRQGRSRRVAPNPRGARVKGQPVSESTRSSEVVFPERLGNEMMQSVCPLRCLRVGASSAVPTPRRCSAVCHYDGHLGVSGFSTCDVDWLRRAACRHCMRQVSIGRLWVRQLIAPNPLVLQP